MPWREHRRYAVLVDAGSSGSRVQVYSWKDPLHARRFASSEQLRNLPHVELGDELGLHWQMKQEPGISSFASHPSSISEHLGPLLDFALSVIPASEVSRTPFYLFATAGVRLLEESERKALLDAACAYVHASTSLYLPSCSDHVRAISGEQEGIYGWIAVNYLMEGFHFKAKDLPSSSSHSLVGGSTYGFLDMGGASTQVAFAPDPHVAQAHAHDMTPVRLHTLGGEPVDWDVFVTTFLGFGTNEARRRHVEGLLDATNPSGSGPAHPEHLTRDAGAHIIHDPCLHAGLTLPYTLTEPPMALRGTGRFQECRSITMPLLNKTAPCESLPCLFNGVHAPEIDFTRHRFIGVSEYWYSSHDVLGLGGAYDAEEYDGAAQQFCSRSWTDILAERKGGRYHSGVELSRLQLQCFKAAWLSNVLHEGLGIPRHSASEGPGLGSEGASLPGSSPPFNHSIPAFQSVEAIGDIQVSWTLGAAILHALLVPPPEVTWVDEEEEHGNLSYLLWGLGLVALWAAWVAWRVRSRKGRSLWPRGRRASFRPRKPYKMTV
ncbi:nucleoside phosphatase GDA1/CD39 [Piptocephalis cylindrospora]|uniref:Nucleoside phosphatase GDA1/CD39 n=1 Tax=Piptocephalis cylindrospora TaxID=1907219 RepID=A0A4P9XYB6_9FUNG|nr:nucleoside phosphatase GDA1/CD39 [Piptocephalis cylindrospora]|eukprot:RKP11406.1 nucleoside phosphatase GDA1/CD39 [Piptocephalis cylindrospora]